ncbi:HdeD family acid-resistance protein [Frankia sp. AgB32]|uniref:HdeD family acid-resistance protein n=1 Tax=Frankia sp. AgB32 TaxID=631119 RepID=UPI00200F811D|nr:DUF308 domain-containing protein [Frankia sp. AgB32]MCK9895574.1 DUF308 domain-containing protein [Frankia sp. AgB32]
MATIYRQQRQHAAPSALWPALLALGTAVTILGLLLITNPFATAGALAVLAGIALILSGISETIAAARSKNTATAAFFGMLLVLGGVIVLVWPGVTLHVVAVVVGAVLIVSGLVRAAMMRPSSSRSSQGGSGGAVWGYVLGALSVVVGILALVWPGVTIVVLAVLFGIQLIVAGVAEIALALALRPHPQHPA